MIRSSAFLYHPAPTRNEHRNPQQGTAVVTLNGAPHGAELKGPEGSFTRGSPPVA